MWVDIQDIQKANWVDVMKADRELPGSKESQDEQIFRLKMVQGVSDIDIWSIYACPKK